MISNIERREINDFMILLASQGFSDGICVWFNDLCKKYLPEKMEALFHILKHYWYKQIKNHLYKEYFINWEKIQEMGIF